MKATADPVAMSDVQAKRIVGGVSVDAEDKDNTCKVDGCNCEASPACSCNGHTHVYA